MAARINMHISLVIKLHTDYGKLESSFIKSIAFTIKVETLSSVTCVKNQKLVLKKLSITLRQLLLGVKGLFLKN